MNLSVRSIILHVYLVCFCTLPFLSKAQTNVKVISDKTNIYTEPDTNSLFHISVKKGDIFEVQKTQNGWIQIQLFSGGKRYLKHSQVEIIDKTTDYPSDPSIQSKLCTKAEKARKKASEKAMAEYPDDLDKQGLYEQLLFDKFMLNIFRASNIPASDYSKLMGCVNDPIPNKSFKIDNKN